MYFRISSVAVVTTFVLATTSTATTKLPPTPPGLPLAKASSSSPLSTHASSNLSLDKFAEVLESGAECGSSEIAAAVASFKHFGSSLKEMVEDDASSPSVADSASFSASAAMASWIKAASSEADKVKVAAKEQAKDAATKVASSYSLYELSKNATAAFKQAEQFSED